MKRSRVRVLAACGAVCLASALLLLVPFPHARTAEPAAAPPPAPMHGCTSTCLDHDGTCLFAENFDFPVRRSLVFVNKRNVVKTGWEPSSTGQVARWTSRYGSVTLNPAGYQFPFSGMNEAGLMVGSMYVAQGGTTPFDARPTLSGGLWVQYQLDNFATVKEVIASEETLRHFGVAMHYLFCDRTGECAVIEYLNGQRIARTGPTLPVKALANAGYEDSLAAWRSHEPTDDAELRFVVAADKLTEHARAAAARTKPDRPAAADRDAAVQQLFQIQASVARSSTVWTALYDSQNLRVYFRTGRDARIRELRFAKLDFTSRTPVRMLDIDADVEGDVSERLPAYSHEQSLAQALAYNRGLNGVFPGVYGKSDLAVESTLESIEKWPFAEP